MVRNPDISIRDLSEQTGWSKDHIMILKNAVIADRLKNMDKSVEHEVAKYGDVINELCKECWQIIQDKGVREVLDPKTGENLGFMPKISDADRLKAIEVLVKNMKSLMDVKFDAGIFKKQLGEMEVKTFSVFVDLVKAFAQNGSIPKPAESSQAGGHQPSGATLSGSPQRLDSVGAGVGPVGEAAGNK